MSGGRLHVLIDRRASQDEQLHIATDLRPGSDEVGQCLLGEAITIPLSQDVHSLSYLRQRLPVEGYNHLAMVVQQLQATSCSRKQAGHSHRSDTRQLREGRLQLHLAIISKLLVQLDAKLVA